MSRKAMSVSKDKIEYKNVNNKVLLIDSDGVDYIGVSFEESDVVFEDMFDENGLCFNVFTNCKFKDSKIDFKEARLVDCECFPKEIKALELDIKGYVSDEDIDIVAVNIENIEELKASQEVLDRIEERKGISYFNKKHAVFEQDLTFGEYKGLANTLSCFISKEDNDGFCFEIDTDIAPDQYILSYAVSKGYIDVKSIAEEMLRVERSSNFSGDFKELFYESLKTVRPKGVMKVLDEEEAMDKYPELSDGDSFTSMNITAHFDNEDEPESFGMLRFKKKDKVFENFPEIEKLREVYENRLEEIRNEDIVEVKPVRIQRKNVI